MDFGMVQKLAKSVVRPPRQTYNQSQLGQKFFQYRNRCYQRCDFNVINTRGLQLKCSFFKDRFAPTARTTILYLHGNSSCRLSMQRLDYVRKNYINTFIPYYDLLTFDFAGCGLSQGQFLTLGYKQKEDVYSVIDQGKIIFGIKQIILWGRSMGAATALLYSYKYGQIKAIISDSSFSDLQKVMLEITAKHLPIAPSFLLNMILQKVQKYIQENAWKRQNTQFVIKKLKPMQIIDRIKCPIFFIASLQDSFVDVQHTKKLFQYAKSDCKQIELVKGGHNAIRSEELKTKILQFLLKITHKQLPYQIKKLNLQQQQNDFSRQKARQLQHFNPQNRFFHNSQIQCNKNISKKRLLSNKMEERQEWQCFEDNLDSFNSSFTFNTAPNRKKRKIFNNQPRTQRYK